jgi:hypothetical protein
MSSSAEAIHEEEPETEDPEGDIDDLPRPARVGLPR